jgi:hypothetical protein
MIIAEINNKTYDSLNVGKIIAQNIEIKGDKKATLFIKDVLC